MRRGEEGGERKEGRGRRGEEGGERKEGRGRRGEEGGEREEEEGGGKDSFDSQNRSLNLTAAASGRSS